MMVDGCVLPGMKTFGLQEYVYWPGLGGDVNVIPAAIACPVQRVTLFGVSVKLSGKLTILNVFVYLQLPSKPKTL